MNAQTKISAKGQIVIPKDVRDRLKWSQGMQLKVVESGNTVTLSPLKPWLKPREPFPRTTTDDLRNLPKWQGPPLSIEQISSLSPGTLRKIFAKQKRDAGD